MGRPMLIFFFFQKSTSITDYIDFYDSDFSLTTLTKLFSKTIHKKTILSVYPHYTDLHENIVSSLTTLTTLILKKT